MTQEEQHIKQKIENLSDLDFYADDSKLWNRLEERLDESKPKKYRLVWLISAAACLVFGIFTVTLFKEKQPSQSLILPKEKIEIVEEKTTKSTPKSYVKKEKTIQIYATQSTENQPIKEKSFEQKQITTNVSKLNSKTTLTKISSNKLAITQQPIFKTNQVTVVDFPIIPDELMKRESFAKRAFRQMKSFNTEGKIDWRELNIEPRNVWAYLERNFKYDTTSIQNKKHIKL
jgi:hypothetical protein